MAMAEYTIEEAREEAYDLMEDYLENTNNHFATGDACCRTLAEVLQELHMMPLSDTEAYNLAVAYIKEHADMVDLSMPSSA